MRPFRLIACIALAGILVCVPIGGMSAAQPSDLPGFLEVEQIEPGPAGSNTFNTGRPYVISIHQKLPGADAARNRLAARLHDRQQLDQFVFEWFGAGEDAPKQLNLQIGSNVPVEAAQAVIAAYASESALPVHLSHMDEDEGSNTQRIYVGSFEDGVKEPMQAERIKTLLDPGLTRDEMFQLIPKATN